MTWYFLLYLLHCDDLVTFAGYVFICSAFTFIFFLPITVEELTLSVVSCKSYTVKFIAAHDTRLRQLCVCVKIGSIHFLTECEPSVSFMWFELVFLLCCLLVHWSSKYRDRQLG